MLRPWESSCGAKALRLSFQVNVHPAERTSYFEYPAPGGRSDVGQIFTATGRQVVGPASSLHTVSGRVQRMRPLSLRQAWILLHVPFCVARRRTISARKRAGTGVERPSLERPAKSAEADL